MKNAPDCPEHVGMPPEAKSPKSSTDAGITKQTKLAVLAALAALATTGCGTKLDDIERLDCEGEGTAWNLERLKRCKGNGLL